MRAAEIPEIAERKLTECDGVHKGTGIFCWGNKQAAPVFGGVPALLGINPPP